MPALGNLNSCASPLGSASYVADSPRGLSAVANDRPSSASSHTRRFTVTYSRDLVTTARFVASPAYTRGVFHVSAGVAPFQTNKVLQGQRGYEHFASRRTAPAVESQ